MGIFDSLFGSKGSNNSKWEEIKLSDKVYPEHSISLLTLKTDGGKPGTGWVDKSYTAYEYKQFCPWNFLIRVDLTTSISKNNPDLDMATIEDFFKSELRKVCVAHMVARLVTDKGLNIEMYLENDKAAVECLGSILKNPQRLVSFNCEINKDPEWRAVSGLMNL